MNGTDMTLCDLISSIIVGPQACSTDKECDRAILDRRIGHLLERTVDWIKKTPTLKSSSFLEVKGIF